MSHSPATTEQPPVSKTDQCPECDGEIQSTEQHRVCRDCGLVISTDELRRDLERSETLRDPEDGPARTSGATSLAHHDGILGGKMGDTQTDTVSQRKRQRLSRQRKFDSQKKFSSKAERNLAYVLSEITRITSALELPEPVQERAYLLSRKAQSKELFVGRSLEAGSGAAVYAAAREQEIIRPLSTFAEVSKTDVGSIRRMYDVMNLELDLAPGLITAPDWVPQFATELDVDRQTTHKALQLARRAEEHPEVFAGKSPSGIAGACLYLASDRVLNQDQVASVVDSSSMTIRSRVTDFEAADIV